MFSYHALGVRIGTRTTTRTDTQRSPDLLSTLYHCEISSRGHEEHCVRSTIHAQWLGALDHLPRP